jgi:LysR family glycine cleavage system transcriptional activator
MVFFNTWLAPRLADFRLKHPDIDLRFTSNLWNAGADIEADIEITYGKGKWKDFNSERLTWDQLIPVCSPNILNGQATPGSASSLNDYTLLHVVGYEEGWGYWLKTLGHHNIDPSQGMHFDSLMTTMEMAALGHGIALSRTSLASQMLARGRLMAPFAETTATSESFFLATPSNKPVQAYVQKFNIWFLDQADLARI